MSGGLCLLWEQLKGAYPTKQWGGAGLDTLPIDRSIPHAWQSSCHRHCVTADLTYETAYRNHVDHRHVLVCIYAFCFMAPCIYVTGSAGFVCTMKAMVTLRLLLLAKKQL